MGDWKRWVAAGVTAGSVLFAGLTLRALPVQVPVHFSGLGLAPDSYGSRNSVLLLAGVGVLLFAVLEVGKRSPGAIHLPTRWAAGAGPATQRRAGAVLPEVQLALSLVIASVLLLVEATARGWPRTAPVVLAYATLAVLLAVLVRSWLLRREMAAPDIRF